MFIILTWLQNTKVIRVKCLVGFHYYLSSFSLPIGEIEESICVRPLPSRLTGVVVHVVNAASRVSSHFPARRLKIYKEKESCQNVLLIHSVIISFIQRKQCYRKKLLTVKFNNIQTQLEKIHKQIFFKPHVMSMQNNSLESTEKLFLNECLP